MSANYIDAMCDANDRESEQRTLRDENKRLRSTLIKVLEAIEEADRKSIKRVDEKDGHITFYTLPCGPWHKVLGIARAGVQP